MVPIIGDPWVALKTRIEAALPGDKIEIPKGIGPPPDGPIIIPKGVTVKLNEPFGPMQIFQPHEDKRGSRVGWYSGVAWQR